MVQKKIIDYRIVEHYGKVKLEQAVITMIKKYGYELHGSMSVYEDQNGIVFCQPMILFEANEFSELNMECHYP